MGGYRNDQVQGLSGHSGEPSRLASKQKHDPTILDDRPDQDSPNNFSLATLGKHCKSSCNQWKTIAILDLAFEQQNYGYKMGSNVCKTM